ncbi:MAG: tRNA uridine-5-carboxymethylaminomethyl(34) synthesis GTPase MnmE [Legionellales bacterium]|nr:tRNA uridine-5-carboxymethylaminomethyl(34) synthesis GTPase MnmE [Legionellales bacterium]|tara:strand:+ start:16 stop:1398 length:1383 start_codon:yes stop_codon:yes gene_type:complete
MGQILNDTIVALATPPGRGGVGIVRLSGPLVPRMIELFIKRELKPRFAHYGPFYDEAGEKVDLGISLFFEAPHSFTGEHVLELQGHGGPIIMDRLIRAAIKFGARMARPGEFTERAFCNNQLDLAQAEAIADLINATSEQAARCALRSLEGDFSKSIHNFLQGVIGLRTYLEASNDFPDEEVEILEGGEVESRLSQLQEDLTSLQAATKKGVVLQEGLQVAVVGKPNAGKSSLFNALTGDETAIVTDIPGTTRDLIREKVLLGGHVIHLVDTAGIRQDAQNIEEEGIRRAQRAAEKADHLLFVIDGSVYDTEDKRHTQLVQILGQQWLERFKNRLTMIVNKIDLTKKSPQVLSSSQLYPQVFISAREQSGVDLLRQHLSNHFGLQGTDEGQFIARRRHLEAMSRAKIALEQGIEQLNHTGAVELLAEDLRSVQLALDEVTGVFSQEDLLGEIFSSFCIGK